MPAPSKPITLLVASSNEGKLREYPALAAAFGARVALELLPNFNSHPNFTKGGDYMWSNSLAQTDETPRLAKFAAALGLKMVAVLHLNTDWGRTALPVLFRLHPDAANPVE